MNERLRQFVKRVSELPHSQQDANVIRKIKQLLATVNAFTQANTGEIPEAYFTVISKLNDGTVPVEKADALLEYLLDPGQPARWEGSH